MSDELQRKCVTSAVACRGRRRAWAHVAARAHCACVRAVRALRKGARALREDERGQGTTEYAILVGVLVVIAIVAIVAFRGRIQSLWDSISSAINGL